MKRKMLAMTLAMASLLPLCAGCASVNEKGEKLIGKLARNGETDYQIVIPAGENEAATYAASELSEYLGRITGAVYAVVDDTSPETKCEILLGKTARGTYDVDYDALGEEGFTIRTVGNKAEKIVIGGVERGLLYGVYTFLEEYCGCGFYTDDCEVVPENASLAVPAIDDTQTPYFEFRDELWVCGNSSDYRMKRKFNTGGDEQPMVGGTYSYTPGFNWHTHFGLVSPDLYFDEHPEYFSMNSSGKREAKQLCLSNPDVVQIAIAKAREVLSKYPGKQMFSVTQMDNADVCRCEACTAINQEEQTLAGTNIRFTNAIAEALAEEFPDVMFDTFAYQYTLVPPAITKPADNVIVRLCSINCCCAHSLGEPCENGGGVIERKWEMPVYYDEEKYSSFDDCLRGWAEICDRIYIWHYTTNFQYYVSPFPNLTTIREDAAYFCNNHVKGLFMQGNYQTISGEFGELRSYLISKVLWNPYITEEEYSKAMNDFLRAYYGAGWESIRAYIDLLEADGAKRHFSLYSDPWKEVTPIRYTMDGDLEIVNMTFMDELNACFDTAEALCAEDAVCLERVKRSRLALRVLEMFWESESLFVNQGNARYLKMVGEEEAGAELSAQCEADAAEFAAKNEALYDDLVAAGIPMLRETAFLPAKEEINFNKVFWLRK